MGLIIPYHNPPHIYLDNTNYFVTCRSLNRINYFNTDDKKQTLLKQIFNTLGDFNYILKAYVILDNHYHILFKTKKGDNLPKVINIINGGSSFRLNRLENKKGRKIWFNYWDRCIRSEKDFWTRFNYVHHNPVKHGYVNKMEDYKFSSYNYYLEKRGKEWMFSTFATYHILDFTLEEDV